MIIQSYITYAAIIAFAAIIFYAVGIAIVKIDFVLYYLVSPEDYSGVDLPHEEEIVLTYNASRIFLHCKIEWKNMRLVIGQSQIFHQVILSVC